MKPKILLIGEAFGAEEEKQGIPFVGKSGQLLRGVLAKASIPDYTLTNVCLFRPPENRKPTDAEIEEEWPRLLSEISENEFIICLGKTAENTVKKYYAQGTPNKYVWFLWHPAYVLRDMRRYAEYLSDFIAVNGAIYGQPD